MKQNIQICSVDMCIYNENGECLLDDIEINELAMCAECILVSVPDDTVQKLKQEARDREDEEDFDK